MKKSFFALVIVLLVIVLAVGACAVPTTPAPSTPATTETPEPTQSTKTITIIEANWTPAQMPPPMDWDPFDYTVNCWMDDIEYKSNGRVVFDRYPMESLVKLPDAWEAVKLGICDIALINECAFPGQFPITTSMRMPGFFEDSLQGSVVRQKLYEEGYFGNEWDDVKLLWWGTNAPWDICCRDKQVKTLDDLKGLKVACTGEPEIPVLAALGAVPVGMSPMDFYLALERGTVDAAWQDINGHVAFKLYEAAPYSTRLPRNANAAVNCVMNKDTYNSLPPDIKQLFDENIGMQWSMTHGLRFNYNYNKCLAFLSEQGKAPVYTLPPEEQNKWTEKTASVIQGTISDLEAMGVPGQEMFDRAHELVGFYELLGF